MSNIKKYMLKMRPLPHRVEIALGRGVTPGEFPDASEASWVFEHWPHYADRVLRAANGGVFVACTTDMPRVTPAMIDWWFGWHITHSKKYQLWHPKAHVRCFVKEDRTELADDRQKYIGNESHVDEYIGSKKVKLTISFLDPCEIGMHKTNSHGLTAIYAHVTDRSWHVKTGSLVHLVVQTEGGSQMRSVFWLGHLRPQWPIIGALFRLFLNTTFMRSKLVSNEMGIHLLRHCAEEMNHLALFLPALHAELAGK